MSADLAAYTSQPGGLDQLDRQSVVALLERGKQWLTLAVQRDTEIGDLVEFKGQAETVRVYTVQKQLGKDSELAAQELIRRADRGIGVAIRRGQELGEINKSGEHTFVGNQHGRAEAFAQSERSSPTDYLPKDELARGIYPVTDGISDEQFEAGLNEAKAEGNLSRANVVRKVTGRNPAKTDRPEVLRGTRRIDSHRVVSASVEACENAVIPSLLDEINLASLETSDLTEWVASLDNSLRTIRNFRKTLVEELNHRG